jgi:hypothetical protein
LIILGIVIILSILILFKKNIARLCILGIYGVDIIFILFHWMFWPDMLNIEAMPDYAISSILFKVIGIVLIFLDIRVASQ